MFYFIRFFLYLNVACLILPRTQRIKEQKYKNDFILETFKNRIRRIGLANVNVNLFCTKGPNFRRKTVANCNVRFGLVYLSLHFFLDVKTRENKIQIFENLLHSYSETQKSILGNTKPVFG